MTTVASILHEELPTFVIKPGWIILEWESFQAKFVGENKTHICYTIQLMHYSHFKTHSLQNLKPIKC